MKFRFSKAIAVLVIIAIFPNLATHWFKPLVDSMAEEKLQALLNNNNLESQEKTKKYTKLQPQHPAKESEATENAETHNDDEDSYFFKCDDPRSNCTYFQPFNFYESKDGAGYPYQVIAQNQSYGNPGRSLHGNYIRAALKKGKEPPRPNFPHDITYIHVRKAGGITMKYSFSMFPATYRIGKNYTVDKVFTVKAMELGEAKMVSNIKALQRTSVMFTFVRDPVAKFVSGAGEVARQGSTGKKRRACFGIEHGFKFLMCCLDLLKTGVFVDEHLIPQSTELYQFAMGNPNATVALFPMKHIGEVQRIIGVPEFASNKRKGVKARYTVNKLTDEMVRDLCEYYYMDVVMARAAGVEVPKCPK